MKLRSSSQMGSKTMPMDMDISVNQVETVNSVNGDGSAQITFSTVSSQSTMNGKRSSPVPKEKVAMRVSPLGHVSGLHSVGSNKPVIGIDLSSIQINSELPAKPVKVGSTWTSPLTLAGLGTSTLHCTLTKVSKTATGSLVVIHGTGSVDMSAIMKSIVGPEGMNGKGVTHLVFTSTFNVTAGKIGSSNLGVSYKMEMHSPPDAKTGKKLPVTLSGAEQMTFTRLSG